MSTGDIAREMPVSFQHAYNVLHSPTPAYERRSPANRDELDKPASETLQVWTQIGEGGRVVIPAVMRAALGVGVGDTVLLRFDDGELRILTPRQALRRAQELVRQYVPEGVSLVDELIAERRLEAARE